MDNMNPMKEDKNPTFKCPACKADLSVETKGEADTEHQKSDKKANPFASKKSKETTATMPIDQLRAKISPPNIPNLNSY